MTTIERALALARYALRLVGSVESSAVATYRDRAAAFTVAIAAVRHLASVTGEDHPRPFLTLAEAARREIARVRR